MSQSGRNFPATPTGLSRQSRRHFLKSGMSLSIVGGLGVAFRPTAAIADGIPAGGDVGQNQWRFCNKCNGLFYDGYQAKGLCPAGGGHVAQGFNFVLPFNTPPMHDTQTSWRFCNRCNAMFYDGYPQKGRCPAGGGHVAQGYTFVLHHDTAASNIAQPDWRFCNKCNGMFYDGYPQKGRCPAGGGHVAQGYNFVLSHPGDRPSASGAAPQPSQVRYCTDMSCAACRRDGLRCSLSIECTNPNAQWACY